MILTRGANLQWVYAGSCIRKFNLSYSFHDIFFFTPPDISLILCSLTHTCYLQPSGSFQYLWPLLVSKSFCSNYYIIILGSNFQSVFVSFVFCNPGFLLVWFCFIKERQKKRRRRRGSGSGKVTNV